MGSIDVDMAPVSKKTICVIGGGRSAEHEVSCTSAYNIANAIDKELNDVLFLGISREGKWFMMDDWQSFDFKNESIGSEPNLHHELVIQPFTETPLVRKSDLTHGYTPDVFFPITHGMNGEDGLLQGVLEYLNVPYVGPGVLGSAVGMDKDFGKVLAGHAGVPQIPSRTYTSNNKPDPHDVVQSMGLPLWVKPCGQGSGVAVNRAGTVEQLEKVIDVAFQYDTKILIEKEIIGRELSVAVMGNDIPVTSCIGEVIFTEFFYKAHKTDSNIPTDLIPAPNVPEQTVKILQDLAIKTYKALKLEVMSRIDFFYVNDNEIYLIEVNTLPGFTGSSLYPMLFQHAGMTYSQVISTLCNYAIQRHEERSKLSTSAPERVTERTASQKPSKTTTEINSTEIYSALKLTTAQQSNLLNDVM